MGSQCVKKKVLRLCVSVRVTISNSITFTMIDEHGKVAAVEIESVFRSVYHVASRWDNPKGTF